MGKKTSRPSTKVSSAASPASGLSHIGSKSSILRAAFSPSEYQLALFASVIQGLDAQHLRIHDTNTGSLQCEHALAPKETVTSLDWGYYGGQGKNNDQSKKKRKRGSDVNGVDGLDQGDVVVAFGTSSSEIRMYSPSQDKVVGTLTGAHDKGIKDFKFTAGRPAQEAWSIGGDNKLVQWDLRTGKSTRYDSLPGNPGIYLTDSPRTIHLPTTSGFTAISRPVPSNPPVICASQTPFLIDMEKADEEPAKFPAMRNQVHTVITSSLESAGTGAFLASDGERFINVFDVASQKLVRNLVAEQDVASVSLHRATTPEKQVLAAVTEDGTIELYTKPFAQPQTAQAGSAKANRKQMTQKANASLKIVHSGSSDACVPVVSTSFQGHEIVVAYAEGGVIPVFERVKTLDENTEELLFTGTKAVTKSKPSSVVASVTTNGAKGAGESRVDETHATVEQGNIVDDDVEMNDTREDAPVSGDEEDSDDDEQAKPTEKKTKTTKPTAPSEDVEMQNADSADEDEEEEEDGAEPSFGELLRANAGQEVDVEAEMDDDVNLGALVPGKPAAAVQQIPTGVSLATVLTQSLKTNDNAMLESCFHTGDNTIIRTTIQRLDSSLAATLLQKLAERLSHRPGRYGHLLVWVQWTCVAHGGALAGHPELLKRMATLYKVMDQRSSSLSSLLLLKGKLDMLDAQLGLRTAIRDGEEGLDSEDEENVIYVEGHDDEDSEAETKTPRTKSIRDQAFDEDESMMNGVVDDSEDDEGDDSEDDEEDDEPVLDIEAAESAGSSDAEESLEENEDEDDEVDSDGSMVDFIADTEDEESDEAVEQQQPPSKKSKTAGKKKGSKK